MIFAEMEYEKEYSEFHGELVDFIEDWFSDVKSGLQGDSWIWIFENNEKVAIDTFSSMKHQIKSSSADSELKNKVLERIGSKYKLIIYKTPELEGHE
jgi:hypothetical protein